MQSKLVDCRCYPDPGDERQGQGCGWCKIENAKYLASLENERERENDGEPE